MVTGRNQSLDVLRAIAVLLVIGFHTRYLPLVSKIGWCGVDLFFVLSGYLISGLLFHEYQNTGDFRLGRFWLRRGLKIWPSLYLWLLAMSPQLLLGAQRKYFLGAAFYYSNFFMHIDPRDDLFFGHTWSLCVEEHFYLLLPILFLVLVRLRRLNLFLWIGAGLLLLCFILRCRWSPDYAWRASQCRMDSLFVGVVLRYLREFRSELFKRISRTRNLWISAALLCTLAAPSTWMARYGLPCLAMAFAILLAWAIDRSPLSRPAQLVWSPLPRLGTYSYPIYLWHQPFAGISASFGTFRSFVVFVPAMIAWGILMSKFVEIPILRVRDRLWPSSFTEKTMAAATAAR